MICSAILMTEEAPAINLFKDHGVLFNAWHNNNGGKKKKTVTAPNFKIASQKSRCVPATL